MPSEHVNNMALMMDGAQNRSLEWSAGRRIMMKLGTTTSYVRKKRERERHWMMEILFYLFVGVEHSSQGCAYPRCQWGAIGKAEGANIF